MMYTTKHATNWTSEEIATYIGDLSYKLFIYRLPSLLMNYTSCLVGVVGNSLTLVVYLRHFPNNTTRTFILGMSIVDLTMNILGAPLSSLINVYFYSFYNVAACKTILAVVRILSIASVWLLAFIALDRYRRICQPFKTQMTPLFAWCLVWAALSLGCVVCFPFIPMFGIRKIPTELPGIKGNNCHIKSENISTLFIIIERVVSALMFLIILSIMAFSYAKIGFHTRRNKKSIAVARNSHIMHGTAAASALPYSRTLPNNFFKPCTGHKIHSNEPSKIPNVDITFPPEDLKTSDDNFQLSCEKKPVVVCISGTDNLSTGLKSDKSDFLSDKDCLQAQTSNSTCPTEGTEKANSTSGDPSASPATGSLLEESDKKECLNITHTKKQKKKVSITLDSEHDTKNEERETVTNTRHVSTVPEAWDFSSDVHASSSAKSERNKIDRCHRKRVHRRKSSRTTLTMFVLTLVYIVNFLPYIIITSVHPDDPFPCEGQPYATFNLCEAALYYFPVLNSVINPFVYSMFSNRFRKECKHYLCLMNSKGPT